MLDELQRSGASLAAILLTHNHSDHIGGVPESDTVASAAGATPSLTMPREWQRHNGEDFGLGNLLVNWS